MNRGSLTIDVRHGLPEVLACAELRGCGVVRGQDAWSSQTQVSRDQVQDGQVHLDDVTGTTQIADVLAHAPGAVWQAWCDERTEAPNLWIAYHPAAGVVEGTWLDDEVVVPITWVTDELDPQAQRWLFRYRTLTGLLDDSTSWHTRAVRLTWNAGFGHPPTDEDLAEHARTGRDPHATAAFRLAGLPEDPQAVCEALFEATNLYQGPLWDQMSCQGLPPTRGHTALSVGDELTLDEHTWRCAPVGWTDTNATSTDAGMAVDPLTLVADDPAAGSQAGPEVTR